MNTRFSERSPPRTFHLLSKAGYLLLIGIAIVIPWCWVYGIGGVGDLQVPNGYTGDGVLVYALGKAYASGELVPGLFRFVATLNPPFTANWNDFPFEDFIYFPAGLMAYVFGLSAGMWLYLLFIQLLAGFSFYFAARALALEKGISAACAVLFALSPFAYYRGLPHLTLTMYWHLPWLLVTLLWCLDPAKVDLGWRLGVAAGLLAGLYNPYYWAMFLFLLAIVLAGVIYRKEWQHALRVASIAATAAVCFFVCHANTLLFWMMYGEGHAFTRDLWGLVVWGLRLPDLVTPVESRFDAYNALFNDYRNMYPWQLKGGGELAYLGLIALSGLGVLVVTGTVRLAARAFERINDLYWIAIGIFSFAVMGGINYLLGAFGFLLLRATGRYSIMLMTIGLLVVAQMMSSIRSRRVASFMAPAILLLGLYDQLPAPVSPAARNANLARVSEDKAVAAALESNLRAGAMVFQLPVKAFPETGHIREMKEYDHLRPWLWTKDIYFSYGTMRGRGDADWQAQLASKPVDQMLDGLNRYGFSALLINRGAYEDKANQLKEELTSLGFESFIEQPDYYGFRLKPVAKPELPPVDQYIATYGKGFHGPETVGDKSWCWADSDASLGIAPNWVYARKTGSVKSDKVRVSFDMQSIGERSVWVETGASKALVFAPGDRSKEVRLEIETASLPTHLHLFSDKAGVVTGHGDLRKLAFRVSNLRMDRVP